MLFGTNEYFERFVGVGGGGGRKGSSHKGHVSYEGHGSAHIKDMCLI